MLLVVKTWESKVKFNFRSGFLFQLELNFYEVDSNTLWVTCLAEEIQKEKLIVSDFDIMNLDFTLRSRNLKYRFPRVKVIFKVTNSKGQ